MLIVERQQRLLDHLRERGAAGLDALAAALDVSTSTVRRDLEALEKEGLVERTHGGAVYRGPRKGEESNGSSGTQSVALTQRMQAQVEAKQAIGKAAAALVQPQMTLILDGGSTVIFAARQITARPIQVVTNSLSIAGVFKDDDQAEVVLIGGDLYPRTEVTTGPIATGTLADLHADLLMFSLAGIDTDAGGGAGGSGLAAFNINLDMARVEQVMLQQASRSVMLMDHTKFGRRSLVRVCGLGEVDQVITDPAVGDDWRPRVGDRLRIAE